MAQRANLIYVRVRKVPTLADADLQIPSRARVQTPTMPTERFDAVLHEGHKGSAAQVPFDPAARWMITAQALRPGRRGFRVHARINDSEFETAIVARSRKFWLLVPAEIARSAAVSVGDCARFVVSPLAAENLHRVTDA